MDKKLKALANHLLDTGKRNNLINFRQTKSSTLEVLVPNSEELFAKAEGTADFVVYDPKITDDEDTLLSLSRNNEEDQKKLDRDAYKEKYADRIKRDQILLFSPWASPLSVLKKINKTADTAIEETGVNVAYMAFGFVHWKENEYSDQVMTAPLLLVPVTFTNDSMISPYHVHMTGDDVVVNPTFSYMLYSMYGFHLPAYEGEDLQDYNEKVEEKIKKLGWFVTAECRIGIFSFLKINMYQDLMTNSDQILENKNVRMLLGEPVTEEGNGMKEDYHTDNPLVQLHAVVDADSSQIEAIEMAKSGRSFVLQGPPGTGKSQTITNIIAECLSDGKKVLFVSEKMAALNVVYDKLKKAGLEEFCLELHSHKANKKAVIDNIVHTLHAGGSRVSRMADAEISSKIKAQSQLDAYERELHVQRDTINMSLYQLYNAYSSVRMSSDSGITVHHLTEKGSEYLTDAKEKLEQYVGYTSALGYDYHNNSWYGFVSKDTSYQTQLQLKEDLRTVAEGAEEMYELAQRIAGDYGVSCKSMNDLSLWKKFFAMASVNGFVCPALLKEEDLKGLQERVQKAALLADRLLVCRSKYDAEYDEDVYTLEAEEYKKKLERQFSGTFSRMFSGEYKGMVQKLQLMHKKGKKLSYQGMNDLCTDIISYQNTMASFHEAESSISAYAGSAYQGIDTDWKKLQDTVNSIAVFRHQGMTFPQLSLYEVQEFEEERTVFASLEKQIKEIMDRNSASADRLQKSFDASVFELGNSDLHIVIQKLDRCAGDFDSLDNWVRMTSLLEEMERMDLREYLDTALSKSIPVKELVSSYQKSFWYQWIDWIIHSSKTLSLFSRVSQDQAVETFAQKDQEQFAISKGQIRASLSAKRPNTSFIAGGSAVAILQRESEKKRRIMSIRSLLEATGNLVQQLKPCFLMSPLSVSTYLSSGALHFDVIVFDEASQIFPYDAIGAIYRGEQLIVVGDSRQMPPSNFFMAEAESDNDEEAGDTGDFESILDICSTVLPQLRLKWHYRSRYEELITFSNCNFYDNELVTFPSAAVDHEGAGVDYVFADGVFDRRSRTNRKEAECIVDLVYKHFDEYPERSLGVVAFSVSQQELIEHLLNRRRQLDPSKEEFFKSDLAEPFFVKNLETVQGDERDTIIFSVGYAKDGEGRLYHNFGPLNRVGGERRLNVAVTRAKLNVKLVASMHHTDIDLSRTTAEGARLLKQYLDYAENGQVALERAVKVNNTDEYDSAFEMEVCTFLRENGFTVDTQVGCSGFRIDLGLRKPDSSDYVLAIECDGATYHASKNARDRDRLRQQVLERMGWSFYRIWSTDWFRNGAEARRALLRACNDAMNGKSVSNIAQRNEPVTDTFEETQMQVQYRFPRYIMTNAESMMSISRTYIEGVQKIAEVEAPISEEWLLKRTLFLFNRTKITNVVREQFERHMSFAKQYGMVRRNGFIYLEGQNTYKFRVPADNNKRDISYIAREELASGMFTVLKGNITVERDGLYRFIVQQLGYSKLTDPIRLQLDEALKLLHRYIKVDGDMITYIKEN